MVGFAEFSLVTESLQSRRRDSGTQTQKYLLYYIDDDVLSCSLKGKNLTSKANIWCRLEVEHASSYSCLKVKLLTFSIVAATVAAPFLGTLVSGVPSFWLFWQLPCVTTRPSFPADANIYTNVLLYSPKSIAKRISRGNAFLSYPINQSAADFWFLQSCKIIFEMGKENWFIVMNLTLTNELRWFHIPHSKLWSASVLPKSRYSNSLSAHENPLENAHRYFNCSTSARAHQ